MSLTDPSKIAQAAEKIYDERHREKLEKEHSGEFVVIDVKDQEIYLGEHPETALQEARKKAPYGVFHLIRIGAPGAFRVSHASRQASPWDWTLRPAR